MYLTQLELRHKPTLNVIKRAQFGQVNCLVDQDGESSAFVFRTLQDLITFALGDHQIFTDNICRVFFKAGHQNYLWFSKTDAKEHFYFDEEELYKEDTMLLRRAEASLSIFGGDEEGTIAEDMSIFQALDLPDVKNCLDGFCNVASLQVTAADALTLQRIASLPHGAMLFLENCSEAPLALAPFLTREDVQIFALGFTHSQTLTVTHSGKAYTVK